MTKKGTVSVDDERINRVKRRTLEPNRKTDGPFTRLSVGSPTTGTLIPDYLYIQRRVRGDYRMTDNGREFFPVDSDRKNTDRNPHQT